MARVCITIPTYDGRALLERYLPSVVAQDAEVVVVDDGSTDGTADWLAGAHPSVRVVRQANAGVSAALNRCLAEAGDAEYVLLLNNDVELTPGFAAALAAVLDAHPEAGSACPKMLSAADPSVLDGAGDLMRWSGATDRRGHGEPDDGRYDAPEAVLSPCGGAAMYRRAALDDVGAFDPDYDAYYEDVDWGVRAQLRGWTCRYEPAAVCFHEGSATMGRAELSDRLVFLTCRNSVLLAYKVMPARAFARHGLRMLIHHYDWLRNSRRDGRLVLHLRAWLAAARMLPAWRAKRRAVQRSARVSLRLDP